MSAPGSPSSFILSVLCINHFSDLVQQVAHLWLSSRQSLLQGMGEGCCGFRGPCHLVKRQLGAGAQLGLNCRCGRHLPPFWAGRKSPYVEAYPHDSFGSPTLSSGFHPSHQHPGGRENSGPKSLAVQDRMNISSLLK